MNKTAKVVIVGDVGVGKSSLALKYVCPEHRIQLNDSVPQDTDSIHTKMVVVDDEKVQLKIHDIAGATVCHPVTTKVLSDADAIIVVFDVTDDASFLNAYGWMDDAVANAPENAMRILVGTKIDKPICLHTVGDLQISEFSRSNKCISYATSALRGENTSPPFELAVRHALNRAAEAASHAEYAKLARRHNSGKCVIS